MRSPKVIISGGGTGGHVFPAIAIADAVRKARPDAEFLFVGALGKMEMERVPAAGYEIEGLNISGFQRSLSAKNLLFPFKLFGSLLKAAAILRKFDADVAVGVGGYASGPLLRVAVTRNIPTLIQEQNSFPGVTNRLLGGKVSKVCVAYSGMERWFPEQKIVFTGNPVRKAVTELEGKRAEALKHFDLVDNKPVLLVIGGSLGARTINQSIEAALPQIAEAGFQVIWQTGKNYAEAAEDALSGNQFPAVKQRAFIDRMDLAYAAADAVVSRAGAISVSELCLAGKPCIFVPSPNVAEDHQTKNARALTERGAALLVKDAEAREKLFGEIDRLMGDPALRAELSANILKMGKARAAEDIAAEVLKLAEERMR